MTVQIVRMITGEDVICDFVENQEGTFVLDPLEISFKTVRGNGTVVLRDWLPKEIVRNNNARVNPRNIIAVVDASEPVTEFYLEYVQKIHEANDIASNLPEEDMEDVMAALMESQGKVLH